MFRIDKDAVLREHDPELFRRLNEMDKPRREADRMAIESTLDMKVPQPEPCSLCGQSKEPTFKSGILGWICCHREICQERRRTLLATAPCEKIEQSPAPYEKVDHLKHYNLHPAGIECIDVIEEMSFNLGNAVKYIWRSGLKPDSKSDEDLAKAEWYLKRERERLAKRTK